MEISITETVEKRICSKDLIDFLNCVHGNFIGKEIMRIHLVSYSSNDIDELNLVINIVFQIMFKYDGERDFVKYNYKVSRAINHSCSNRMITKIK